MKFNSEIFDQLQLLFETYKFNDHQIHCIINFDNKIDKNAIKKAVSLMIDVIPILGSAYVEEKNKCYWEKLKLLKNEDIITIVNDKDKFNEFMTSRTSEFVGPQIKFCLLNSNKDSLGVIINHMICDAAGFKKCMYLFSYLYSELLKNPNYVPNFVYKADRSIDKINKEFKLKDKIKVLLLQGKESNKDSYYKFPISGEKVKPFILTHKITENKYEKITDYCRKYNVTINDVILAAYYRVIYKVLNLESKSTLNIPIMVDMRRYLKTKNTNTICNLTSMVVTSMDYMPNDNFNDSVLKINKDMKNKKNKFIGLNGFIKISIIFQVFNYNVIKKFMRTAFKNPLIGMSNIGVLDSQKLSFLNSPINEAFMSGSIKYPPYFQLSLSSYNNTMTFSVNLYGNSEDEKIIKYFFDLLEAELP